MCVFLCMRGRRQEEFLPVSTRSLYVTDLHSHIPEHYGFWVLTEPANVSWDVPVLVRMMHLQ